MSILVVSVLFLSLVSTPLSAQVKDWTLAVFLNADNNLDPFGVEDQKEMSRVGSNANLNIVTLIDRERGPAQINYIEKNKIKKIKKMGELDMGDYKEFVKFAKFVKENYPAKHYCFTIWNHGSGWKNKGNNIFRGISYDDSSNNHITNAQLSIAVKEVSKILGQKIDVLTMDACLMQMVEVNHAIKDSVKFMIASEELEPGRGASYDTILAGVKKNMTPRNFALNWVEEFSKSYQGGSQGYDETTQSAIDLDKFDGLLNSIDGLAKAIMSGKYSKEVRAALRTTQSFAEPENISLLHFVGNLKKALPNASSVKTACDKVLAAGKAAVIINKTTGYSVEDAKGIAIYLPYNFKPEAKYKSLGFAKSSMWVSMMTTLAKQKIAASIVASVEDGDLDEMRKFVASANKNPRDLNRSVLQELNFSVYSENKVQKSAIDEFEMLFSKLKSLIKH